MSILRSTSSSSELSDAQGAAIYAPVQLQLSPTHVRPAQHPLPVQIRNRCVNDRPTVSIMREGGKAFSCEG